MTKRAQELIDTLPYLLLDGAMGTMLMDAGLESGAPPEEWNVLHPERVQAVHRQYIEAGSNVVLTNSFGGSSFRLKLHNMQDRVAEFNRAAAEVARAAADAADHPVLVAGSLGPTGELLAPMGDMTHEQAVAAFAEQAAALAAGGADLIWVETMSDLNEVRAAVEGARSACDLPVAITMTFDTRGYTMMGVSPAQAVEALSALDPVAIGANCGNGIDQIKGVLEGMLPVAPEGMTLIAKSNAGIPKWINNQQVYDGTPAVMADYARYMRSIGVHMIGGCCGSTPAHIRAMKAALEEDIPIVTLPAANATPVPAGVGGGNGHKPRRERRHRRKR